MRPVASLQALGVLGRRPDLVLAAAVASIVAMLIVPLPALVLDALIAVNVAFAVTLLMAVLFSKNPLELSSFPTLLLLSTLFRLGLNVSTTRGILAHADAGEIVVAFGAFVTGGDLGVGLVMFLVITLIQFLVIAKGAERVAEVGARFSLDAMPGRQMSIDAAVRSGFYDEAEAERRRELLSRESQLFGNMDGAMKFVKGDAIAGLVITALNLVAGMSLGVLRDAVPLADAAELYTVLTIGDALVSQIPAVIITLAAGVLVTRVVDRDEGRDRDRSKVLGFSVKREVFGNQTALWAAAAVILLLAIVPGLPGIPFFLAALLLAGINLASGFAAYFPNGQVSGGTGTHEARLRPEVERKIEEAKAQRALADQLSPSVAPLGLDLDPKLGAALGFDDPRASEADLELLGVLIPQLRDALYLETGVRFPAVFVRSGQASLGANELVVRVNDVPVLRARVAPNRLLAIAPPDELRRLGVTAEATRHPLTGTTVASVPASARDVLEASGITVWSAAGVVTLHIANVLRKRAASFIGLQEVAELVERMEKVYPALVKEVVPKVVSLTQLVGVLRRLVEEGVSIRDLKSIFEALGEHGDRNASAAWLTERARAALASQLAHTHAGLGSSLSVVLLDPVIEDTIAGAIRASDDGEALLLEPEISRTIVDSIKRSVRPIAAAGVRPTLLVSGRIRRLVRKLIEVELAPVAVLAFDELPQELVVHPLATARLD
ncbi:flagellar biosynthesis protein FlhA [Myxococcota bacterium]|nr:flagellar biosynthesis protein FlhA [Myxococcota bacterium]